MAIDNCLEPPTVNVPWAGPAVASCLLLLASDVQEHARVGCALLSWQPARTIALLASGGACGARVGLESS